MRADFNAFAVHTVRAYADIVLELMREFFPNKLIGSNRFMGGATEAMYGCWSGYDFIAVNSYPMATWGDTVFTERKMDMLRLAHQATGRPVLLTEWGVQAMDVAMQSPSATLWTQAYAETGLSAMCTAIATPWRWARSPIRLFSRIPPEVRISGWITLTARPDSSGSNPSAR